MKKYVLLLILAVGSLSMTMDAKDYDILGVYRAVNTSMRAKDRVLTYDGEIVAVNHVLEPATIRERTYEEVTAVQVGKSVYRIEASNFSTDLYIELDDCNKKGTMKARMVIDNIKGEVKGRLTFK